ncbi:MAG: MFS transporter [Gaiellales bacterium]|jgi:EmrB/QacA subfamily drug resistance transporter|nr:MFS transporter [Gaiellales bacterium]
MEAAVVPDPKRWLALGVVAGGVALIIIDSTIVNVALPTIIRDLQLGLSGAQWVNSIYSLVFAALLIASGRFADMRGRRIVFMSGLAIFAGASILSASAGSGEFLIFARFLQGIGAALVLPSTLSIVNATFQGKERTVAFGVWGATIGGMAALGPILGGVITTNLGWRWIFLVNIPIAMALILLSLKYVRESRDANAKPTGDAVGAISIGFGLAALVFALIGGLTYGWWSPNETFSVFGWNWPSTSISLIPFAFAFFVISVIVFFVNARSRERGGRPLFVDLSLFRLRSFGFGNLTALLVSLGEFGLLFVIPLYLQSVLGLSATESGLMIACLTVGAFATAGIAAPLSRKIGQRGVVQLGMSLEAVGLMSFALIVAPGIPAWHLIPALIVYGFGIGFSTSQLTGLVLSEVPVAKSGQASGIQSTSRQIGSALGVALLGVVLATVVYNQSSQNLENTGMPPAKASAMALEMERSAGTALPQIVAAPDGAALAAPLGQAFSDATRYTGFAAAFFVLIGLGSSMLLPRTKREE